MKLGGRLKTFLMMGFVLGVCLGASESVPQEEKARQLGANAAAELQRVLKAELSAAMQGGGPGQAIRVCAQKALLLTRDIPQRMELPALTIKRTSVRWRNEMNRPDAFEERILADLEARVKAEAPLEPLLIVQNKAYHYFEPIRTVGLCLTCHGPEEKMPENVKSALDTLYPGDRARGYAAGDFRGVIHVTIPLELLAEP